MTTPLRLRLDDFKALRHLIYQHSGIWLGDTRTNFLGVRIAERLRALAITTPREYYHLLKDAAPDAEIAHLVDAVTVNETWFFREMGPIQAWRTAILPTLRAAGDVVRVWCAGCSTGEEPYSLAMTLLDDWPEATTMARIVGTDISHRALDAARAATYDAYSLRHTDQHWRERYFEAAPAAGYAVVAGARRLVSFSWTNLADPALAHRVAGMDLVLCRNVMIYFNEASKRAVLANLTAALKPGGYLIVGHTDMLSDAPPSLEGARVGNEIMYRKPPMTQRPGGSPALWDL